MTRKGENGSVVSFIVVGVLLAVLVIGGLYSLKQRSFFGLLGQQPDTTETVDQVASQTDTTSDESAAPSTDATPEQETASEEKSSSSSSDTSATTEDSSASATDEQTTTSESSSTAANAASELPETGPADALLTIVAPAALVGAFLTYRRSYQL